MRKKRIVSWILVLGIFVLIGLGLREVYLFESRRAQDNSLREQVVSVPRIEGKEPSLSDGPYDRKIDWNSLHNINPDIVGWIYVPDTVIDYPVLMGDKYEKADEFGNYSYLGSIFVDKESDLDQDNHVIVFGHNMRSGQMFGKLKEYLKEDYAKAHSTLYLYTPKRTKEYHLTSLFTCDKKDEVFQLNPTSDPLAKMSVKELNEYLEKRCNYTFETGEGNVITLSSCYGRQGTSNRLTVHFSVSREKYVF